MSISIQNLSGHPQPFLYDPQHLKYLLDVDEGIWAVCTGHVDNLSLPRKLLSHLDQDGDQLILAKDIKQSIRWCLDRIENPDWFFIQDSDEEHQKYTNILSVNTPSKYNFVIFYSHRQKPLSYSQNPRNI